MRPFTGDSEATMPRVLHILNELRPSGAETMLRAAAGYWRGQGIESAILITGETRGDYAEALANAGYRLHHLPFRRSVGYLARVYRFFKSHDCEGIHIHCERANFWFALLAYCAGRRRIVRSVHSLFRFSGLLRARRFAQRFVLRALFGVRTIAVSPAVQRLERDVFANPALSIPNWFDADRFRPPTEPEREAARRRWGIPAGAIAITTVGNCAPVKNHAAVIGALASLPDCFLYLHAGCEDEGRSERLLAAGLGVADRVRLLGAVDDVEAVLQAADLFVMPSLYEGLGLAAVEALAAGLPAVLADVEGLRDLRAIAPECEWIRPGSDEIAAAVLRVAKRSRAERAGLGALLSARVHCEFSVRQGARQYAALYEGRGAPA